jgi:hypothetical protein
MSCHVSLLDSTKTANTDRLSNNPQENNYILNGEQVNFVNYIPTVFVFYFPCRRHNIKTDAPVLYKHRQPFLSTIAELRKVTVTFVMCLSVCLSVCPSVCVEQLGSRWTDYDKNLIFENFSKICRENSTFIKI